MRLVFVVALVALLVGVAFASLANTICGADISTNCPAIWFSCVQNGVANVDAVGLSWGEPQGTPDWQISPTQWIGADAQDPDRNIAKFYVNGLSSQPLDSVSSSNFLGQGMWGCTLDLAFVYNPTQTLAQNDFGTGSAALGVDLFRREFGTTTLNNYNGWNLAGLMANLQGNNPASPTCVSLTGSRLQSVPNTASPPSNQNVATMIANMQFIGGSTCGNIDFKCYASDFDPCQAGQNGCPANTIRVGAAGTCCPTGSVIVGSGTAADPARCCPAGNVAVLVPSSTRYICCPAGQTPLPGATTDGDCCPPANYVPSADVCCPFPNPTCQSGATGCTVRNLDGSNAPCCPANQVNDPLGTSQAYTCCPTAVNTALCNFRKRDAFDTRQQQCEQGPGLSTVWVETSDGQKCCPPQRATSERTICCPSDPPAGQWFEQTTNVQCCPSGRVSNTDTTTSGQNAGDYCCPTTASGTVQVTGTSASGVDAQCCPVAQITYYPGSTSFSAAWCCPATGGPFRRTVDGSSGANNCCPSNQVVGSTQSSSYCCPAPPPSGQTFVTTTGCPVPSDCKCCPSNRASTNNAYCCPTAAPSGQTLIKVNAGCANAQDSNCECCPSNQVTRDSSSQNPYCCPATGGPFTQTSSTTAPGTVAQCCPTTNVVYPENGATATSGLRCCPAGGAGFAVTTNDPCCPVNRVSSTTGAAQGVSNSYCCPTAEVAGNPFIYLLNGVAGTTPQCCPQNQVSSNTGTKYCCPTAVAGGQYYDTATQTCCPASEWDGTRCCPGGSLVSVTQCASTCGVNNVGVTCSTTGQNDGSTTCCQSTTSNNRCCPSGSWFASGDCCPANRVAYSDFYNGGERSTVCCPTAGDFQLTLNTQCCPVTNIGKCGTEYEMCDANRRTAGTNAGPVCCPSAGQLVADVIVGGTCAGETSSCANGAGLSNLCCPASNALILDGLTTCSNSIYCCPTAVDQQTTVVAVNVANGQLTCCPESRTTNGPTANVPETSPIGFITYNPLELYCCPDDQRVWVSASQPCCLQSAAVLPAAGGTPCYCCPNTNWCQVGGTGCTCENLRTGGTIVGPTGQPLPSGNCYDNRTTPGDQGTPGTYVVCVNSTYWAQYPNDVYVWTSNQDCCPQSLVTYPVGSTTPVCCPPGGVGTANLAQFPSLAGTCCPIADAVTRPGFTTQWCCPDSLLTDQVCPASCVPSATTGTGTTCQNNIYCTASCGNAWSESSLIYAQETTSTTTTGCGTSTYRSTGCCPSNRASTWVTTGVQAPICCPDPSWLPAGATWLSGLDQSLDNAWFPNNCCPSTWRQNTDTNAAGVGSFCCPAANNWLVNWGPSTTETRCCPDARRVFPTNYTTLSVAQKAALTDQNGVFCCPAGTAVSVTTTTGVVTVDTTVAGFTWGWFRSGGSRCCPAAWLLTPIGPVTGAGSTWLDDSSRLCCPAAATGFTYTVQNGQTLCCPVGATSVTPVNTGGSPRCCPACGAGLDCSGTVYWSQGYNSATNQLTAYDCCVPTPEAFRITSPAAPSPAVFEELNICCPQPSQRTGCSGSCPSGDQSVNFCCPVAQVLSFPNVSGPWDWRDRRCCPVGVNPTTAVWIRAIVRNAIGVDSATQNGAFTCCPPDQVNDVIGPATTKYCCPLATDTETVEATCCPAERVTRDTETGLYHCCPGGSPPYNVGYEWAPLNSPTGTPDCCPVAWLNRENTTCCPTAACQLPGANCRTVGSNACCPSANANNAGTACCPGSGRIQTDNDPCCPAATAIAYTLGASSGTYCCPGGITNPVVVPNPTGGLQCCPASNVLNDAGTLRCCPQDLTAGGLTPSDWVWSPIYNNRTGVTGAASCCPRSTLNVQVSASLPGGTVCCPDAGETRTNDTPCCPDYATVQSGSGFVACCPIQNAVVVGDATSGRTCCPANRVVDDGSGPICCPGNRWNNATGQCCPLDSLSIAAQDGSFTACCPIVDTTPNGLVCCLSPWWSGVNVSKDDTGSCCPVALQNPVTGSCCPANEKDYLGVCCPNQEWGLSIDAAGVVHNRSCCPVYDGTNSNKDCAGYCLPPDGETPVYYNDTNGVCCPYNLLDCALQCPQGNVTLNTVDDAGVCCPPDRRDCLDRCFGNDLNCCENINNCTGCSSTPGCGWCGLPSGDATARCQSGNFFGATGNDGQLLAFNDANSCAGDSWIFTANSTITAQLGPFTPENDLQWTLQRVVLAPNQPIVVPIQVRAPASIPLDLFFLQDLTNSFDNDIKLLAPSIPAFLANITALVPDVWFGWGSFMDKPLEPFGVYVPGLPQNQDYLFRVNQVLAPAVSATPSIISIYNTIAAGTLTGGGDTPEGSLEGMLGISDVAGSVRNVGWRPAIIPATGRKVVRVAIVVTDAPPHQDADIAAAIATLGPGGLPRYPNLGALNSWNANDLDPYQAVFTRDPAAGANNPQTLEGYGERYPNMQDVADIWTAANIFPIFLIAPTEASAPYLDEAWDQWNIMSAMFPTGRSITTRLTSDSSNLQDAVISALETVTQTITLVQSIPVGGSGSVFIDYTYGTNGILSDPNNPPQAEPGTVLNYTVRLFWDGTPPCTATVTQFCVPQPETIPFDALFPIQGTVFEQGWIEVVVGVPSSCGFCPDGIFQPWLGEQCDPLDPTLILADGSPNPCCALTCTWTANAPCDQSNLCAPLICTALGECVVDTSAAINCVGANPVDPAGVCSTAACVPATGECVFTCIDGDLTGLSCCDDGNNCTLDICVNGQCTHVTNPLCDCATQVSCVGCAGLNTTEGCVWDALYELCYTDNVTQQLVWVPADGNPPSSEAQQEYRELAKRYAWDNETVDSLCFGGGNDKSYTGAIVGGVLGAATLASCFVLALVAAIWARMTGKTLGQQPWGNQDTLANDDTNDNPLYAGATGAANPLFDGASA